MSGISIGHHWYVFGKGGSVLLKPGPLGLNSMGVWGWITLCLGGLVGSVPSIVQCRAPFLASTHEMPLTPSPQS